MKLRAPTIDDAPAALEVLVAREIADIGVPDYRLEDVIDEWRATEFDLTADSRVVELRRRMGLRLEDLRDHPRTAPDGMRLRPLNVEQDAIPLHALDDASFANAPDYHPTSLRAFREEHLGAQDVDPQLSRVAELGGRIAGFLLARRWDDAGVGFVDILAVHPNQQGNGIGTALLAEAFHLFRAAGLEEAQLGVASSNPRALSVYERLGMTPRFRYDTYERPTTAFPTSSTAESGAVRSAGRSCCRRTR